MCQHGPDEIFLGQGKYTIEILRRFGMMDCKSMTTPMEANLKKSHDCHIFRFRGSYHVPPVDWFFAEYMLCSECIESTHGRAETSTLDNN